MKRTAFRLSALLSVVLLLAAADGSGGGGGCFSLTPLDGTAPDMAKPRLLECSDLAIEQDKCQGDKACIVANLQAWVAFVAAVPQRATESAITDIDLILACEVKNGCDPITAPLPPLNTEFLVETSCGLMSRFAFTVCELEMFTCQHEQ